MERKVLGRGLDALITKSSPTESKDKVVSLKVTQIHPSRFQPRTVFAQSKINELAESIREKGFIQPVIVRARAETDQYELIAGERRWRAAKSLGIPEVPAIVRRVADEDVLEMSIVENVQREELNTLEEARAYQRLAQEFGLSQDQIARKVGKDKSSISNILRILNLPDNIQQFIADNLITFGHARALLSLEDGKRQWELCEAIVRESLSVRQTEIIASGTSTKPARKHKTPKHRDPNLVELERRFEHVLGTKVRVHHGKKRGRIEIEYYSLDDLDRLTTLLTSPRQSY